MSPPMTEVFQIRGPSDNHYPGTFCLPQVPVPVNVSTKVGDLATIQVSGSLDPPILYSAALKAYECDLCSAPSPAALNDMPLRSAAHHSPPQHQSSMLNSLRTCEHLNWLA